MYDPMKKKLSADDYYRVTALLVSIGFYFLGKYLSKLNYEILSINLFTILSWFCYFLVLCGIINLIKNIVK